LLEIKLDRRSRVSEIHSLALELLLKDSHLHGPLAVFQLVCVWLFKSDRGHFEAEGVETGLFYFGSRVRLTLFIATAHDLLSHCSRQVVRALLLLEHLHWSGIDEGVSERLLHFLSVLLFVDVGDVLPVAGRAGWLLFGQVAARQRVRLQFGQQFLSQQRFFCQARKVRSYEKRAFLSWVGSLGTSWW